MAPKVKNLMEEGMRWFGPGDTTSLAEIRQTGATCVYTSLYEIPYGEAWPAELIASRQKEIASHGLVWSVVESVPVSEAIKTRTGDFERHIENYQLSLQRLGAAGITTVIYNFMPVLDWVRTDLQYKLPDGTEALLYDPVVFAAFDLFSLKRPAAATELAPDLQAQAQAYWHSLDQAGREHLERQTLNLFPGVKLNMGIEDLRALLGRYASITRDGLKSHLKQFLDAVIPVAEKAGVRLAIHPDDPPFSILGLPRIVCHEEDLADITRMNPSLANGLCYCTGSLSARADNDLPGIVNRLGPRINAVHLRSVQREDNGVFYEANHLEGSMDMPAVVKALLSEQRARISAGRRDWQVALRPDHGHTMLDDLKKPQPTCPGYSLIGRMRGLAELRGLQLGISRSLD